VGRLVDRGGLVDRGKPGSVIDGPVGCRAPARGEACMLLCCCPGPSGETGRRTGLKIPGRVISVRVRFPPRPFSPLGPPPRATLRNVPLRGCAGLDSQPGSPVPVHACRRENAFSPPHPPPDPVPHAGPGRWSGCRGSVPRRSPSCPLPAAAWPVLGRQLPPPDRQWQSPRPPGLRFCRARGIRGSYGSARSCRQACPAGKGPAPRVSLFRRRSMASAAAVN
jgi:hypothetical protein